MAEASAGHRSISRVMLMTGALALVICAAFEAWRPAFFFTNDNVTQWMPPMVEMARNLQTGKPAFVSEHLFGGNYDWSTDATIFPLISPILPLLSPLAQTPVYFVLVDAITIFEFVVIAVSFAAAAAWLRRRHHLPLGDRVIVGASLSYAFAPLSLLFGTSWMGFINAQAAWPLVFVALQFRSAPRSIGLMLAAFVFAVFGGNLHPFSFLALGSLGWAICFSWRDRSPRPLLCLLAAMLLLLGLIYLVLGPGLSTIASTGQIRHFTAAKSSLVNFAPLPLAGSFFLGPFAGWVAPWSFFGAGAWWSWAIAYSAINLPSAVSVARGGWRRPQVAGVLVALVVIVIFIWRPAWLGDLVAATPVLRSTRWPFREINVLLFHVHLLFLFTYRPLLPLWNRAIWIAALVPLLFLIGVGPPTLGPVDLSRRLIMSGAADEYWKALRPSLGPEKNLVSMERGLVDVIPDAIPFPLLPSHNFPAIFGVVSVSGYSSSTPLLLESSRMLPIDVHGIYTPDQAKIFLEHQPNTRLTLLRRLDPPVWSIIEGGTERTLTLDPETLVIRSVDGN